MGYARGGDRANGGQEFSGFKNRGESWGRVRGIDESQSQPERLGDGRAALTALTGPAGGQEVSEHGNPWITVTVGKVTVQAEAVRTPERLYLGLSDRRELPEGRGSLLYAGSGGADLLHARDAHPPWISSGLEMGA